MCSAPVSSPQSTSNCGQTPITARTRSSPPAEAMPSPYTSASPPVGGSTPVRQLMVVVLPAPLGPSRQKTWPRSIVNQEPLIAQNSLLARARPRAGAARAPQHARHPQHPPPPVPRQHRRRPKAFWRPYTSMAVSASAAAAAAPPPPAARCRSSSRISASAAATSESGAPSSTGQGT
jgi:hypothetical protein